MVNADLSKYLLIFLFPIVAQAAPTISNQNCSEAEAKVARDGRLDPERAQKQGIAKPEASPFEATKDEYLSPAAKHLAENIQQLARGKELTASVGGVIKRWDPNLKTMIYHSSVEPNEDGTIPLYDPKAEAVAVFFHGSGTMKSSGRNFVKNMNQLAEYGVSSIAMDLPFHGESQSPQYHRDLIKYMKDLHKLIGGIKRAGKKVVLFGHSFGPELAAEYAKRYPDDVTAIVLASPTPASNKPNNWMYTNVTDPMMDLIGGNEVVEDNDAGAFWADNIEKQTTWHKTGIPSSVKVRIVVGSKDEWWPPMAFNDKYPGYVERVIPREASSALGNQRLLDKVGLPAEYTFNESLDWFKQRIPHAEITVVDQQGHYVFEAEDLKGRNILNMEVLDVLGLKHKEPKPVERSIQQNIAALSKNNPEFVRWVGEKNIPRILKDEDLSKRVLEQWSTLEYQAWKDILLNIEERYPAYYDNRRFLIARTLQDMPKTIGDFKKTGWGPIEFQNDFIHYLENRRKLAWTISEDPATPHAPKVDPNVKGRSSPIFDAEAVREDLNAKGQIGDVTPVGKYAVKVDINFNGRSQPQVFLNPMSDVSVQGIIQEAYLDAWRKNDYLPVPTGWKGEAKGLVFKVTERYDKATKTRYISAVVIEEKKTTDELANKTKPTN